MCISNSALRVSNRAVSNRAECVSNCALCVSNLAVSNRATFVSNRAGCVSNRADCVSNRAVSNNACPIVPCPIGLCRIGCHSTKRAPMHRPRSSRESWPSGGCRTWAIAVGASDWFEPWLRGLLIGGGKRSLRRKGPGKGPGKWRKNGGSAVGCCMVPGKSGTRWSSGGASGPPFIRFAFFRKRMCAFDCSDVDKEKH